MTGLESGEESYDDFALIDDGTLEIVIELSCGHTARYSTESSSPYRDVDGVLDVDAFIEAVVIEDGCGECE